MRHQPPHLASPRQCCVSAVFIAFLTTTASPAHAELQLKGVALGHYTDIKSRVLGRKLREIKHLGATHVSVVVSWSMRDVRSSKIYRRKDYTTPDRVTARIIRRARRAGLRVVVFPIIDVQNRKPLEWRGTLKPKSWDRWWQEYRRFIMNYARIAAQTKAEVLTIGSELVTTESMRARWESLVKEIRATYSGKLLYSANWDHYRQVSFWDQVDLVGLTAYYKLAEKRDAPEAEMVRSWKRVRNTIAAWSRQIKRRVIFTELGYPSQDGCAVSPWDYTQGTAADVEEQKRAFSSFVQAWRNSSELSGVVIWDWYGEGGLQDTRYSPRNKPAQKVIEAWFKGERLKGKRPKGKSR